MEVIIEIFQRLIPRLKKRRMVLESIALYGKSLVRMIEKIR